MPKMKLTEKSIARLRAPDPSGKQVAYWDETLRGFGVLCSGISNARSYVVQRDLPNGKTRRVTLASVAELSHDAARQKARETLLVMRGGIDPKELVRSEVTLRAALDNYLKARADYLRPASVRSYSDAVHKHLGDWLDTPLRNISREMVETALGAIARQTGNATANGTMRTLRVIYNFALDRAPPSNPLPPNPVRLKKLWLPVPPRTRSVATEDLPKFYRAVTELPSPVARDYLLLLLFTGFRRNEAAALRWSEVDLQKRVIRLPASRAKAGRKLDLPMSDLVHDLLVARRALGDATWVFPANSKSGHLEEPKSHLKLVAATSGINVSVHDLRRTFMTIAESTDMSVLALKALVNHSLGNGVTEGYVQMSAERLRQPAQRVAERLKTLIGIAPVGVDNITKLKG